MIYMKWNIEPIIEGYEWLVDFRVEGEELVYVVSINYEDIDWENMSDDELNELERKIDECDCFPVAGLTLHYWKHRKKYQTLIHVLL